MLHRCMLFLYLITVLVLDRLRAGSCLVISNLCVCVIGHYKEQTVWLKRKANRNGLPRVGAKGKSTTIQTNTKRRKGGVGMGEHWQLSPAAWCLGWGSAKGERAEQRGAEQGCRRGGGVMGEVREMGEVRGEMRVTAWLRLPPTHTQTPRVCAHARKKKQLESFLRASPWRHTATWSLLGALELHQQLAEGSFCWPFVYLEKYSTAALTIT